MFADVWQECLVRHSRRKIINGRKFFEISVFTLKVFYYYDSYTYVFLFAQRERGNGFSS